MQSMDGIIKTTAVLINPDGVWEEEMPVQFEPGRERAALLQLVGAVANGLIRFIGTDELEFIPPVRVKSITMKLNSIVIATDLRIPPNSNVGPRPTAKY